ncbi:MULTISPECIES: hypothetical protein [unclassified Pseudoalteromonas]|uniref:hypothetical protein n=1 Tax=unclassified Pseudoalteromonas TaxID=194690 RepID=UPI000BBF05F9|nr:hypothetical protein [Pseudoalteromonas sp. 1_2015MBL_MicDiv]ATG79198.1 hypothetical protein AOR04_02205 [Pseudoalteromonas sp. 1_2015MBL_MicDiv]
MHTYSETNTHELILTHQHKSTLYDAAKAKADSTRLLSEYDRKRYFDELFSHTVLAQLSDIKIELASHGYASEVMTKTAQLESGNTVVDFIYEVTFKFNGNLQSDNTITSGDSQMVFFTQPGSNHIACRYKTAQLNSQIQHLYFDDEGYSHFLANGESKTLWHGHLRNHSELASILDDFISLIFIEKRTSLSRI